MTGPAFKVEGIHQTAPFRPRGALAGHYAFGREDGAVLVGPATARRLRRAASRARPSETGGLLAGRTCRDGDGHYVLISGFVEAPHGSGQAAAFDISPQVTDRLREESFRRYPTADVVGWWHSHLRPSRYSSTDEATQSMWSQPHSAGLLVFAAGEPWATAYLGPQSRHLGDPAPASPPEAARRPALTAAPPDGRARVDGQPGPALPASPGPGRGHARQPAAWLTHRQRGLAGIAMLAAALVLALVLLAALRGLSSQLRSTQRALSGQISSGQRTFSSQINSGPVRVSCHPGPASAAATAYTCAAQVPARQGTVTWLLDGKTAAKGPAVTIRIPADGRRHRITAVWATSAATYASVPRTPPGRSPAGRPPAGILRSLT